MNSRIAIAWHAVLGAAATLLASTAGASYIPPTLDVIGLRTPMQDEGYLHYRAPPLPAPFGVLGHEYTGWIDVRAPSLNGAQDRVLGYDRSNRSVAVDTKIVTDGSVPPQTAQPQIARDFEFANRIFAQSGLSIVETGERAVVEGGVTFPLDPGERSGVASRNRAAAATTINNWYVGSFTDGARGYTHFAPPGRTGTLIADSAVSDTFAHEVGHMLTDGQATSAQDPADPAHSTNRVNLLGSGAIRWYPGQPQNDLGPGDPPFAILNSTNVAGPAMSTFPDGSPKVGGIDMIAPSQNQRIFDPNNPGRAYVNLGDNANNGFNTNYGDRVDWNFVVDQLNLEGLPGADMNGIAGDPLYFGGGATTAPNEAGHDHDGLGLFGPEPDYAGSKFRFADVFSIAARYGDSDIDADPGPLSGFRSARNMALDYDVTFLGLDLLGNLLFGAGTPVSVFTNGWTDASDADNFLARWLSPFDAFGMLISPHAGDGRDGAVQIDAVIVAAPEPSSLALLGLALVGCGLARLTRRRSSPPAALSVSIASPRRTASQSTSRRSKSAGWGSSATVRPPASRERPRWLPPCLR